MLEQPQHGTEYGMAAFLVKRLIRPSSYSRGFEALSDIPRWRRINRIITNEIEKVGEAFSLVQIGANDGNKADPVRDLIKAHRFQALLVEPVPRYFDALRQTYISEEHVRFANVAVSETDGIATLHAVLPSNGRRSRLQGCSSFDREVIEDAAWVVRDVASLIQEIQVPTVRLKTLLDRHDVSRVDYLVVDTEGHDRVVVDQIADLTPHQQPKFILYEHNHLRDRKELEDRLRNRGYQIMHLRRDTFAFRK